MEDKDYKKLYEEAIERAKYALTTDMDNSGHWAVNYIFPQLKENKDEKVMKALIHLVKSNKEGSFGIDNYDGIKWDDILSWIEIQGEHKHFRDCIQTGDEVTRNQDGDIVNLSQLKRIAKPKPKFKTGDWIQIDGGHVMKILEVKKDVLCYRILNWCGNENVRKISDIDSIAHLWTIQDANDGDVLKEDSCTFIIERMKPDGTAIVRCCLFDDGDFDLIGSTLSFDVDSTYPATKEQRDLFFQKMKEADYEWDAEKKELKKIEQKLVDKIEPKFKVGEWIINNDKRIAVPTQILEIEKYGYVTSSRGYISFDKVKTDYHLWTIQDAEDGDVLAEHETIVLFKKIEGQNIRCYCTYHYLGFNPTIYVGTLQNKNSYCPATNEQSDLLFQKMKETGYEWDFEKKELRTIEKETTWSEEDESILNGIMNYLCSHDSCELEGFGEWYDWLKSLKDRVQPQQKQEWSEEDERNSAFIVAAIDAYSRIRKENDNKNGQDDFDKAVNWIHNRLKYLHPQSSQNWKPSEEQLKTLWDAIIYVEGCHSNFRGGRVLELLYNELKQL